LPFPSECYAKANANRDYNVGEPLGEGFSQWTFPGNLSYDFEKFLLHFLKTLVDQSSLSLSGSGWFFEQVSLGRFYSSRPSVGILTYIVSE